MIYVYLNFYIMKGFSKFSDLAVAAGLLNKFDKSSVHVTTNDFFFLLPAMSYEVMAKERIKVNMSTFSRATPMSRPAYVDVDIVNHAFFVPYRTVWPQWTSFYDGTQWSNLLPTQVPVFDIEFFLTFVAWEGSGRVVVSNAPKTFFEVYTPASGADAGADDLRFTLSDGSHYFVHMKPLGKRFIQILQSLGYNFPLRYGPAANGNASNYTQTIHEMSALPLLSMLRIWFDYFMPSNKDCSVVVNNNGTNVTFVPESFFTTTYQSNNVVNALHLAAMAHWLTMVPYQKDYYQMISSEPVLSEIDNASMPLSGYQADGTQYRDNLSSSVGLANNIPQGSPNGVTAWVMQAVSQITKFFQRDQFAGVRNIDRYLARFGITLTSEQLQRCVYLGKQSQKVDVSAQWNTSPTSGSVLGDYAGKADSYPTSTGQFSFHATEFGQFIIVSQILPKSYRYQGLKREMLHLRRNEFFQPEFDSLGYQGVSRGEFANVGLQNLSLGIDNQGTFNSKDLFGWIPRYAEYKQGTDKSLLTGDFRVYTAGAQSYETMQLFRQTRSPFQGTRREFFIGSWDATLDRVFVNQSNFYDHFITYYSFDVTSYMPARKLFDVLDDIDGEHHENVSREVGGSQL